jgi:hypothetical protein
MSVYHYRKWQLLSSSIHAHVVGGALLVAMAAWGA